MLNIHHLELFYYVARHGGISEAVRNIPYGIQQPAVSSQVILLEESLGTTLFQRRPFQLTEAGEGLYAFIKPFFDNLGSVEDRLRSGGTHHHLRVGAAEVILREHLPGVLQSLKRKFPSLKVTLRSGFLPQLESLLIRRELDFAVTLVEGKPAAGLNSLPLLQVPLCLLVPESSTLRNADELWRRDRIDETLISLPANESIARSFQEALQKLGVDWFPGIEVSSLDAINAYVRFGYGIGLGVMVPDGDPAPGVRVVPLPKFPAITIGALWQGRLNPISEAFLAQLQERAKRLSGESPKPKKPRLSPAAGGG